MNYEPAKRAKLHSNYYNPKARAKKHKHNKIAEMEDTSKMNEMQKRNVLNEGKNAWKKMLQKTTFKNLKKRKITFITTKKLYAGIKEKIESFEQKIFELQLKLDTKIK